MVKRMGKIAGRIEIDPQRCKGCELCVAQCPQKAITIGSTLNQRGYYFVTVLHPERCTGCALCAEVCPDLVIVVFKGYRERLEDKEDSSIVGIDSKNSRNSSNSRIVG